MSNPMGAFVLPQGLEVKTFSKPVHCDEVMTTVPNCSCDIENAEIFGMKTAAGFCTHSISGLCSRPCHRRRRCIGRARGLGQISFRVPVTKYGQPTWFKFLKKRHRLNKIDGIWTDFLVSMKQTEAEMTFSEQVRNLCWEARPLPNFGH